MGLPVFNSRIILAFFPSSFHINGLRLLRVRTLSEKPCHLTHGGVWRLWSCSFLPNQVPQMFLGRAGCLVGTELAAVGQGLLKKEQGGSECLFPFLRLQLHLAGRVTTHCFCWQHYCKLCMLKTTIFFVKLFWQGFFFSLNSNSSLIAFFPVIQNFPWSPYIPRDIKS